MIYLDYLLEATLGALRQSGKHTYFDAFSHDSRQVVPGELFVAVRGVRGNGHDYLLDAVYRGARGVLVEASIFDALPEKLQTTLSESEVAIIAVEDTRVALQQYARFILARWRPTVIAVTGSVGKTSTKEAIAHVLSRNFSTFRSWQNYNDLLGIPLSLGRLETQHEYAVLELGCDHPGEIADLCRMIRPQIGVLTNISPVQMQYFGSVERLTQEFGELLAALPADGSFFYNQADEAILHLLQHTSYEASIHAFAPLLVPGEQPEITAIGWDGIEGTLLTLPGPINGERVNGTVYPVKLTSHLLGAHNFNTMLTAYQVAVSRGMHPLEVGQALASFAPLPGRLNPLPGVHDAYLLDDTHNAARLSAIAALETLSTLASPGGLRIAVLGDMLHLGDYEEEEHRRVGQHIPLYADYLITYGERAASFTADSARHAGLDAGHIIVTSTYEDAAQAVRSILARDGEEKRDIVLIKGSEDIRMERVTELLMAQPWEASAKLVRQTPGWKKLYFRHAERPTWVEVDLNAIGSNTRHLKALVGAEVRVLVSLKADAYGHGALKVARTVLHNGASMLGVATATEAVPLREGGIVCPILVFGYIPGWQMREAVRLGVTVTLYSIDAARELSRTAVALGKSVKVHVKIDTGMGRLGIRYEQSNEIVDLLREIIDLPGLELEGLYTHFATADSCDLTYARRQLARFETVLEMLDGYGLRPSLIHAANSAATLSLPEARFDMVRPGIAIYGLQPSDDLRLPEGFRPALSFKTQVSQVKWIPAGEGISYGCTYITERPTLIAVLPVGYADGFRRTPQNWGSVLIHGQQAPLLGRVCMDQCMVDITDIPQTRVGDEVVLIGHQGEASLSAEMVAQRLGTINYEVVSEILARVPRVD